MCSPPGLFPRICKLVVFVGMRAKRCAVRGASMLRQSRQGGQRLALCCLLRPDSARHDEISSLGVATEYACAIWEDAPIKKMKLLKVCKKRCCWWRWAKCTTRLPMRPSRRRAGSRSQPVSQNSPGTFISRPIRDCQLKDWHAR